MKNPSEVVRIPDNCYNSITPNGQKVDIIQWTPKMGGWVRVRLNKYTPWRFVQCESSYYAQGCGLNKLYSEKLANSCYTPDYNYQGA